MKKTIYLLIIAALALGVASCKRSEIDDPIWDDPAGFQIQVEGSVSPALQVIDGRTHTSQVYIKVTDGKNRPLAGRTIFLEQLSDPYQHKQLTWGYFTGKKYTLQAVTDANGEIHLTFYWPTVYHSEEMWIHALAVIDGRAYKMSETGIPGNIPQDFIALTMYRTLN